MRASARHIRIRGRCGEYDDRRTSIGRRTVIEFAVNIRTPTLESAGSQSADMEYAAGDLGNRSTASNRLYGRTSVHESSVADLPIRVPAPAPDRSIGLRYARMRIPGRNGRSGDASNGRRKISLSRRSIADLTERVQSPAFNDAYGRSRTGMVRAERDLRNSSGNEDRSSRGSRRSIAEFAIRVRTPTPEVVRDDGARVIKRRRDLSDAASRGEDHCGSRSVSRRSVSDLPGGIAAPALESSRNYGAGMVAARADLRR